MRRFKIAFNILGSSYLLASCATSPPLPPEVLPALDPNLETIAILGTNDIHGALAPMQLKTREPEGSKPIPYEAGGLAYLASYVNVVRGQFGDRLIWLDGGDEFQGTIESNLEEGAPMVQFFNASGLTAAAIGNHEFDFGPEGTVSNPIAGATDVLGALKKRLSEARYPYLAANVYDRATKKLAELPNTFPSKIVQAGAVKVGIIGLSTLDTPRTTRAEFVAPLHFSDLKEATMREARALRGKGADAVVITSHVGLRCAPGRAPTGVAIRKVSDPQGSCDGREEMVKLLRSLPEGTVDAVISGHSHSVVHHWVNGVPVIQGGSSGRYINLIYLTFDKSKKRLLADRTRIEGPIPICPAVFSNQGDCNGDRPAPKEGRGSLTTPRFHGHKIKADSSIEAILDPVFAKSEQVKKQVVGQAARTIEHERFKESPLGNLVADSFRHAVKTDVAIMNAGGVRAPIEQGTITYGTVFRSLPFDNAVSTVRLTGKQLKTLIRVAESGSRGFPAVSGMRLTMIDPALEAPSTDLNGDRRIEPWEINRLLDLEIWKDDKYVDVKDGATYTLATIDFLLTGGDDWAWPLSQISQDKIQLGAGAVMRDAFIAYIADKGPLNSVEAPLVDPANPRIKFEKPRKKKKAARRKRGKRR